MKYILVACMISTSVFADCNLSELRKEMKSAYRAPIEVNDGKGGTGKGIARNFVVSDYLMKIKDDNFLIGNFEMDISWENGNKQRIKSLVVSTVDLATCTLENLETEDTFGTSLSSK